MKNMTNNSIICLMGPTASGKTALAIELRNHLPCEIISVDSALIYRGMDIGTAKPTADELEFAPHRLINICDPKEIYSVGMFLADVAVEIEEVRANGHIPLLVGGTMMYFYLLQNGLSNLPEANDGIRQEINAKAETVGWGYLYKELCKVDPVAAMQIHPHDTQRIQRALEVFMSTGNQISQLQTKGASSPVFGDFQNIILMPPSREDLHHRIKQRLDKMFAMGFIEEVQALYKRGDLYSELPSIRTIGYRQVWQYLAGEYDYVTMCDKALFATRQFAKRQCTWLRRWPEALQISSGNNEAIEKILRANT